MVSFNTIEHTLVKHFVLKRSVLLWGRGLSPHLTQYCLGRGLPPYQVVSRSIQPFGHNRDGPKIALPLWGKLGPHLTQCGVGRGLPLYQVASWSIQPFGDNTLTPQTGQDRQLSDSIGRTVLQTVAQQVSAAANESARCAASPLTCCKGGS